MSSGHSNSERRLCKLVPIFHGRMVPSRGAFCPVAAITVAANSAHTPSTRINVYACQYYHPLNIRDSLMPEWQPVSESNDSIVARRIS
jgi:hypothetical protein